MDLARDPLARIGRARACAKIMPPTTALVLPRFRVTRNHSSIYKIGALVVNYRDAKCNVIEVISKFSLRGFYMMRARARVWVCDVCDATVAAFDIWNVVF